MFVFEEKSQNIYLLSEFDKDILKLRLCSVERCFLGHRWYHSLTIADWLAVVYQRLHFDANNDRRRKQYNVKRQIQVYVVTFGSHTDTCLASYQQTHIQPPCICFTLPLNYSDTSRNEVARMKLCYSSIATGNTWTTISTTSHLWKAMQLLNTTN